METSNTRYEDRLTAMEQALIQTQQHLVRTHRRLQATWGLFLLLGTGGLLLASVPQAHAQFGITLTSLQNQITALTARVTSVEGKTQYMSVDTNAQSTTFSGCNVFINDGGGNTSTIVTNPAGAGVGNLIIGYNVAGNLDGDIRTGSHNLIMRDLENYNSFGGIVTGYNNASYNHNAVVIGGNGNRAFGDLSCIFGGGGSTTGQFAHNSVVCGGNANVTNGINAVVSGGNSNVAQANLSAISGGFGNVTSGDTSSISGGNSIRENDYIGWAAGGYHSP